MTSAYSPRENVDTLLIHTTRGRAVWVAAISIAGAALCGWFAWELADPNFSTGGSRRVAFLEGVPVWLRVGFFGACALACLYALALATQAATRTEASFAIGPDGVSDLRKTPPHLLAWADIGEASADGNFLYLKRRKARSALGFGRLAIPLVGVEPGRDVILAAVAARLPATGRSS